ncbi:tyrosine-type recombinase/integrase [Xanthobacter sediminis]|uniref:tyrosine-type recombinase/integrase n=1 Tax=Xanthobacter sediminis TaxID=3119926 RepID=UPI0037275C72
MRVKSHLKGVASASFRLADGSRKTHYYAWRGGPPIKDGDKYLQPDDPRFVEAFNALQRSRRPQDTHVFQALIDMYLDSEEFAALAPRTQYDYRKLISDRPDNIQTKFGKLPLAALSARHKNETRGIFKGWRDQIAKRSRRQADYAWVVLARICSVALDRGRIESNPCERGGRIYRPDRSEKVWSAADEQRFLEHAPPHLHLAILLAIWTGQRQGDLLKLAWSNYDGATITLRQGKTGRRVTIPVGEPLKIALDVEREKKRGALILLTMDGTSWTDGGFRASWRKACAKAKVIDLTFHDLRGTAVTRLAVAGCTVPEIASLTGHSLKDVEAILDAHYLSRDRALAQSAIAKLEKGSQKEER